jgi:hypothetical protein
VRSKLQLLQDTIAGSVKSFDDVGASKTLQPAESPAKDATIATIASTSAKSSEAADNAGDRRDTESDPSGDQGVEPPDQHRKLTPSVTPSLNLSSTEGDLPKSSSPDATASEGAHLTSSSRRLRPQKPLQGLTDFGQLLESIIPGASHRRRQSTK